MEALELGAEDFNPLDDVFEVYTAPADFSSIREALEGKGYEFLSAEIQMIPQNTIQVDDDELMGKIERMLERFDDNDDVQEVYHNAMLPEAEEED